MLAVCKSQVAQVDGWWSRRRRPGSSHVLALHVCIIRVRARRSRHSMCLSNSRFRKGARYTEDRGHYESRPDILNHAVLNFLLTRALPVLIALSLNKEPDYLKTLQSCINHQQTRPSTQQVIRMVHQRQPSISDNLNHTHACHGRSS